MVGDVYDEEEEGDHPKGKIKVLAENPQIGDTDPQDRGGSQEH